MSVWFWKSFSPLCKWHCACWFPWVIFQYFTYLCQFAAHKLSIGADVNLFFKYSFLFDKNHFFPILFGCFLVGSLLLSPGLQAWRVKRWLRMVCHEDYFKFMFQSQGLWPSSSKTNIRISCIPATFSTWCYAMTLIMATSVLSCVLQVRIPLCKHWTGASKRFLFDLKRLQYFFVGFAKTSSVYN